MATTGYSGKALSSKLGIQAGATVAALGAPDGYRKWLEPLPQDVRFESAAGKGSTLVHVFATERSQLAKQLSSLRRLVSPSSTIWVSWPKKASKVPTDITEDTIRELALPLGFVDVKVCAVSDVWSGLKLVVRKALR